MSGNKINNNQSKSLASVTFFMLIVVFSSSIFLSFLPVFKQFFISSLKADVYSKSYEVFKMEKKKTTLQSPNYITNWYVDVNHGEENNILYEFNPLLSISLPSLIAGIFIAILFSLILPHNIGYMRTKISREIEIQLHKLALFRNSPSENTLKNEIINLDIDGLRKSSEEWGVSIEDLNIIKKGIIWSEETNFIKRLFTINDGLSMYMRFHFTYKYSNIVLGFVYIGAAVLIIIVGLRGLKFIPVTMPSLILFALSLEFSLLVTYAFTIMYGKQEEEQEHQSQPEFTLSMTGRDYGSNKEIESFLRAFISKNEDGKK